MLRQIVNQRQPRRVYIVADNDEHEAGWRGAIKLACVLGRRAKVVTLPAKDLRAFKIEGGTNFLLNEILNASV
jgi:uncharacterized membrane protein